MLLQLSCELQLLSLIIGMTSIAMPTDAVWQTLLCLAGAVN